MTTTFMLPPDARVGALVPSVFTGRVRGTYRAAINVELYDAAGSFLVSVIRNETDWTELAVLLPIGAWERLRDAFPATGSLVTVTIPERPASQHPSSPGLPSSPGPAATENPPARHREVHTVLEDVARILSTTAARAGKADPTGSGDAREGVARDGGSKTRTPDNPLPDPLGDGGFLPLLFHSLVALQTSDDPFVRRAATVLDAIITANPSVIDLSPLVGLGIGFTPSGDDFISGALLTVRLLGKRGGSSVPASVPTGPAPVDTAQLWNTLGKTTSGGATLLRLALNDTPPAYQLRILDAIAANRPEEVVAIARSHGHSSGLDALTGTIWMARHLAGR